MSLVKGLLNIFTSVEKSFGTDDLDQQVENVSSTIRHRAAELEHEVERMQAHTKRIELGFNIPSQD